MPSIKATAAPSFSQADPGYSIQAAAGFPAFGREVDGDVTVSGTKDLNTQRIGSNTPYSRNVDAVVANVSVISGITLTLTGFLSPGVIADFQPGDCAIIINLQGTAANNGNVGNFEYVVIDTVGVSTVNLKTALTNLYGDTNNSSIGSQKVILMRIPEFKALTLPAASSLTCSAWNGSLGGVIAFFAKSIDCSGGGSVSANAKGFRGATAAGGTGEGERGGRNTVQTTNIGAGAGGATLVAAGTGGAPTGLPNVTKIFLGGGGGCGVNGDVGLTGNSGGTGVAGTVGGTGGTGVAGSAGSIGGGGGGGAGSSIAGFGTPLFYTATGGAGTTVPGITQTGGAGGVPGASQGPPASLPNGGAGGNGGPGGTAGPGGAGGNGGPGGTGGAGSAGGAGGPGGVFGGGGAGGGIIIAKVKTCTNFNGQNLGTSGTVGTTGTAGTASVDSTGGLDGGAGSAGTAGTAGGAASGGLPGAGGAGPTFGPRSSPTINSDASMTGGGGGGGSGGSGGGGGTGGGGGQGGQGGKGGRGGTGGTGGQGASGGNGAAGQAILGFYSIASPAAISFNGIGTSPNPAPATGGSGAPVANTPAPRPPYIPPAPPAPSNGDGWPGAVGSVGATGASGTAGQRGGGGGGGFCTHYQMQFGQNNPLIGPPSPPSASRQPLYLGGAGGGGAPVAAVGAGGAGAVMTPAMLIPFPAPFPGNPLQVGPGFAGSPGGAGGAGAGVLSANQTSMNTPLSNGGAAGPTSAGGGGLGPVFTTNSFPTGPSTVNTATGGGGGGGAGGIGAASAVGGPGGTGGTAGPGGTAGSAGTPGNGGPAGLRAGGGGSKVSGLSDTGGSAGRVRVTYFLIGTTYASASADGDGLFALSSPSGWKESL